MLDRPNRILCAWLLFVLTGGCYEHHTLEGRARADRPRVDGGPTVADRVPSPLDAGELEVDAGSVHPPMLLECVAGQSPVIQHFPPPPAPGPTAWRVELERARHSPDYAVDPAGGSYDVHRSPAVREAVLRGTGLVEVPAWDRRPFLVLGRDDASDDWRYLSSDEARARCLGFPAP
ncbi:MAG TPA: hypothetical protein RMH99_29680 [Sandaracinaceae bacterium LLY-WYZ-13_1]|nr:hypothetical protein [Sandaracinaceae bacterium LLY-WYZ-13_1]